MNEAVVAAIASGGFALVGVAAGSWFSARAETARWRRDYAVSQTTAMREHLADVVEAANEQVRIGNRYLDHMKGEARSRPSDARVAAATDNFARLLARSLVLTPPPVTNALYSFDTAVKALANTLTRRCASSRSVRGRKRLARAEEAIKPVNAAYGDLLAAIDKAYAPAQNATLSYLLPIWLRAWVRLRWVDAGEYLTGPAEPSKHSKHEGERPPG